MSDPSGKIFLNTNCPGGTVNIFSHLSNVLKGSSADAGEELTPEELEAQAKADRIKFHRESVRNGPVTFKSVTNGQIRRAKERAQRSATKKQFKADVRSYFDRQRVAAILRPHLQTVGILSFASGREAELADQITSTAWICQRYGTETTVDGQKTGHVSFLREDVIAAVETATAFYRAATGYEIKVPADFEPAIYVALDRAEHELVDA